MQPGCWMAAASLLAQTASDQISKKKVQPNIVYIVI